MECKICKKEFKNLTSLGKHLFYSHNEITKQKYYDTYIGEVSSTCGCGKEKKFRGLGEGYRTFCSMKCRSNDEQIRKTLSEKNTGKVQSKETIQKRIKNTNQIEKEKNRKATCLARYGVDNPTKTTEIKNKIVISNTGKLRPRKEGQQEKIIETRRRNGTLKHTKETKEEIKNSVNALYQSDNPPVTISENNNKNHKSGYFNGTYYRSSYELRFMEYCFANKINYQSAENKEFRLEYIVESKRHWYYPDFYLEKYDAVIEIKPDSLLTDDVVLNKINTGMQNYRFFVITEEELYDLTNFFQELEDEYIHTIDGPSGSSNYAV